MEDKKLNFYIKSFLEESKLKSIRNYKNNQEGLEVFENFIKNYSEISPRNRLSEIDPRDVDPGDIEYILQYFQIRKYMCGDYFFINSARTIKRFFVYLEKQNVYEAKDTKHISKICEHYANQYLRIGKINGVLWNFVEKETNDLMRIPNKKAYETQLKKLQQESRKCEMQEMGYVEITKIENNKVFGICENTKVGPVLINETISKLLEIGDIVNMITLRKRNDSKIWEICELGYVYPKPYGFNKKSK